MSNDEEIADERAVTSIALDTEDGGQVTIQQQNVGPANQVGGGEFKNVTRGPTSEEAAARQDELEDDAPIGTGGATDSSDDPKSGASSG